MVWKKKSALRKLFLIMIILCACVVIAIVYIVTTGRIEGNSRDGQLTFGYVALGDSIPNGYTVSGDDSITAYPQLLAKHIEEEKGITVHLSGYTRNGLTTAGLYEKYLSDKKVQESLRKADLITVTIGANDILNRYRALYRAILSQKVSQDEETQLQDVKAILKVIQKEAADNPELLTKAARIISGWDCDDFEEDWKKVMEYISQNRKEGAKVIVTTIYNPVGEIKSMRILNRTAAELIDDMNGIITENAEVYRYQAAELSEIRTEKYLQSDGLHPSQEGQQMIMDRIVGAMEEH